MSVKYHFCWKCSNSLWTRDNFSTVFIELEVNKVAGMQRISKQIVQYDLNNFSVDGSMPRKNGQYTA